jgi:hypothetical protein
MPQLVMVMATVAMAGSVTNEGCLSGWASSHHVHLPRFQIPYRALVPATIQNLLITCAVSGTHVGSASLRLEPQCEFACPPSLQCPTRGVLCTKTTSASWCVDVDMGMGHAAGVAVAMIVLGNASSVHSVPIGELQALLIQQGVDPAINHTAGGGGGGGGGYVCGLGRCIASPGGRYRHSACAGACQSLGTDEWLGSVGAWSFNGSVATAMKATHLKRSTESSALLNGSMAHAVPRGATCELTVDGHVEWEHYFVCSVP